jgi:hypothetical protein
LQLHGNPFLSQRQFRGYRIRVKRTDYAAIHSTDRGRMNSQNAVWVRVLYAGYSLDISGRNPSEKISGCHVQLFSEVAERLSATLGAIDVAA